MTRDPRPARRGKARLRKGMTTGGACSLVIGACMEEIAAHQACVRDKDDAECVHRMRVGVRRLRAALSTFRRALPQARLPFEGGLRWLQDLLGSARDWDVFRETEIDPLAHDGAADLRPVAHATAAARKAAYQRLRAALRSQRYEKLLADIVRWRGTLAGGTGPLRKPIRRHASAELRRRAKKVRKRGRRIDELEDLQLHRLRIRAKKLRYTAEFFRSLFPAKRVDRLTGRLRKVQRALGTVTDARKAIQLAGELRAQSRSRSANGLARGEGLVEGWATAQKQAHRAKAERQRQKFAQTADRWP